MQSKDLDEAVDLIAIKIDGEESKAVLLFIDKLLVTLSSQARNKVRDLDKDAA